MELRWTKEMPTADRPGWYWCREENADPVILLVDEDGIHAVDVDSLYPWENPDGWPTSTAEGAYGGSEWAGPINLPLEPDEDQ